ncbi:MAG TPA: hypothetical protein VLA95_09170 [Gemmatimonadales bacterium]|nr:hypothetical protein [Gemmatimonadales bacterium]
MKRTLALAALLTLLTAVESALSGELLNNEALYLFAAWKWWRPEFLAHDWSFAVPWREHALFNAAAGLLSLAFPLGVFKWVLRVLGWFAVYAGLVALLRRLAVPWWAIPVGVLCWQVGGEAFVGGEWVIGGAEAKVPAYAALFASLAAFLDRRHVAGGLLLGLCFSLHPAVGAGALAGVGAALLADRTPWRGLALAGTAGLCTAAPGLLASAGVSRGTGAGDAAWEYIVRARLPHHLDPFTFAPGGFLALAVFGGLLALLACRWRPDRETRFVAAFVAGTALLFAGGIAARAMGAWPLLQVYPFRLLPLVLPMLVTPLLLAEAARHWRDPAARRRALAAAALGIGVLLARPDRWSLSGSEAERRAVWGAPYSRADRQDQAAAAAWVADSAPPDAVVLATPTSKRAFWDYRRALVVNWSALRYDRFAEWRRRIDALAGPVPPDGSLPLRGFDARYDALGADSMAALGARYGATLVVTHARYPFPLRFRAGAVSVYALPTAGSLSPPADRP